jgi:nucleotide-binding universal stress UspA family protein
MYRRILVPLDGSSTAYKGFEHALTLASAPGCRLRLLHVVDDTFIIPAGYSYPAGDLGEVIDSLWRHGRRVLTEAQRQAAARGIEVEVRQVQAHLRAVSDVILQEARDWHADLMVMGTHGRRGVRRLVLGSDAERVLREAPVPILLVRADPTTGHEQERNGLASG